MGVAFTLQNGHIRFNKPCCFEKIQRNIAPDLLMETEDRIFLNKVQPPPLQEDKMLVLNGSILGNPRAITSRYASDSA